MLNFGDYVFVKLTVELSSKTVGVFDYEGEAYIKQLIIEKDKAYLRSFNIPKKKHERTSFPSSRA